MYSTRKNETGRWKDLVVDVDVTTFVCSQKVQNVETNLTLEYPSLTISASNPPILDEDTVQWLRNTTAAKDGTTFQFAVNNMLIPLDHPHGSFLNPWKQTADIDRFMQALAYIAQKEDNLTLTDILGPSNKNNLQNVVAKLYGRYMAQAFSSNMRVDINQDTPNITFTGAPWIPPASSNTSELAPRAVRPNGLSEVLRRRGNPLPNIPAILTQTGDGGRTRMVQNRGPKIALQIMLGFMTAGAILTRLLSCTKELLPHEPYSIAGRAILIANGNILRHDTAVTSNHTAIQGKDKDGNKQPYRLGWWKGTSGVERYGICIQD